MTEKQIKQETLLKECKLILETLFSQNILSDVVYSGLIRRLNDIEIDPYNLLLDFADQYVDVLEHATNTKYRVSIKVTPL